MDRHKSNHCVIEMTPKRMRRLEPLFSRVPKEVGAASDRAGFFHSCKFILVLAQCFALMPVQGVTGPDITYIRFKWRSLKLFYSLFSIVGALTTTVLYLMQFMSNGKQFSDIVNIIFYLSSAISSTLFIRLAYIWLDLNKKWSNMEYFIRKYPFQPQLTRRFKITTSVVMLLALGEHILSVVKIAHKSQTCPISKSEPMKAYFGVSFSHVFSQINYSHWVALYMEISNILATFTWNFTDLFVMLMCAALAERFRQLNKRVNNAEDRDERFWKVVREDYTRLAILCKSLDEAICHIVTLSFGNNLFFICVQLFHTLKPFQESISAAYFLCSFGFLLARTAALSVYCCWINDESKYILMHLFDVPSEIFGTEASRLIQQISFCPVVITGSNYFAVTRGLCLQVAGAIITFELILVQLGPVFLKTDKDNEVFCLT